MLIVVKTLGNVNPLIFGTFVLLAVRVLSGAPRKGGSREVSDARPARREGTLAAHYRQRRWRPRLPVD